MEKRRSVSQPERSPSNDRRNSRFTAFSIVHRWFLFLAWNLGPITTAGGGGKGQFFCGGDELSHYREKNDIKSTAEFSRKRNLKNLLPLSYKKLDFRSRNVAISSRLSTLIGKTVVHSSQIHLYVMTDSRRLDNIHGLVRFSRAYVLIMI